MKAPPNAARLVAVAAGGAVGAAGRYGVGRALVTSDGEFPVATFAVNVAGAFVLAVFLVVAIERWPPEHFARSFFAVGVVGSFTTFSTLSVEVVFLVRDGALVIAGVYVVATLAAGLAAAWTGWRTGHRLNPSPDPPVPILVDA